MSLERQVIVCSACETESCWQGVLMCDEARSAGVMTAPKVKNGPSDDLENPGAFPREIVTEHGLLMSGGGYQIRPTHLEIERIYPLAEWIAGQKRMGAHVFSRRIIVMEEWTEL